MPVRVATSLPASGGLRRAARWDGIFPVRLPQRIVDGAAITALDWAEWWLSPPDFVALKAELASLRTAIRPFDVLASGRVAYRPAAAAARADVAAYAAAGVSWWCEWVDEASGTFDASLAAIERGSPR